MFGAVKSWLIGLSLVGKIIAFSTAAVIGGTVVSAAASNKSDVPPQVKSETTQSVPVKQQPTIEIKTVTESTAIPFGKSSVNDGNLAQGSTAIKTVGVNGVKTFSYEVTYTDGVETNKKVVKEEVTTAPITEVTSIGTYVKPKSNCDSNYSGACVPIASDVDCAGGSGNGPAYVSGPVYVIGSDIYGLDRDGDGIGCE